MNYERYKLCAMDFLRFLEDKLNYSDYPKDVINSFAKPFMKLDFISYALFDISSKLALKNYFNLFKRELKNIYTDYPYDDVDDELLFDSLMNSYVSVFKVLGTEKGDSILVDTLLNKKFALFDKNILKDGEQFITRIVQFKDCFYAIGSINLFNADTLVIFDENKEMIFSDQSIKFDLKNPRKEDLKDISLYIYNIFNYINSLYIKKTIEISNEDFISEDEFFAKAYSIMFNEEDFDKFLKFITEHKILKEPDINRETILYQIYLIYNFGIKEIYKDRNFSFKFVDYDKVYRKLCEMGEFLNTDELYLSIVILKSLLEYLNNGKKTMETLENVHKNIFEHIKILRSTPYGIFCEDELESLIYESNISEFDIFMDFENFYGYVMYDYLTEKSNQDLGLKNLRDLIEIIGPKPIRVTKNPTLKSLPLLELLLNFALIKNIIYRDGNLFEIHDESSKFMELENEQKLAIWLHTLTNENFYLKFLSANKFQKGKKTLISLLVNMGEKRTHYNKMEIALIDILKRFGMVEILDSLNNFKLTDFGIKIYNYFDKFSSHNKILDLNNFKSKRN